MRKRAARSKGKARRRARLSDVAARAGVSAVTVSRAIRKPEMVSEDVRRRIDAAVRELGYAWRDPSLAFQDAVRWFRDAGYF